MHEVDPTVVARARAGDADAFRSLVERHSRYLFGVAHRLTGSAADAEDVVQEAWLRAHRHSRDSKRGPTCGPGSTASP